MTFTPPEHQEMLARAHEAIDVRDRRQAIRQRAGLAAVLTFAACAAALLWWPRAAPLAPIAQSPPEIALAASPPPAWLQIITSDEEIEASFAEAGECARVVRVDHKILTVACSDLAVLPRVPGSEGAGPTAP